jgi:GAF domain-containing protein
MPLSSVRVEAMKGRSRTGGKQANALGRTVRRKSRIARKVVRRRSSSAASRQTEVARLTRELEEEREQQIATGDVLKVVSRSSFDLQAVLDTLVKLAARLCEAELVAIHHHRDGVIQFGARFGLSQEWEESTKRNPIVPGRGTVTGRVLLVGKMVQISDVKADPEYTFTEGQKAGGFRTVLGVPLEREGQIIGVIVLARTKVFPFNDRQIEFVKNFAAQAVIAIENTRLLSELRDSLQEQTATSEVLRVISSSPGDLQPVFASMLEKTARICDATFGNIYRWDGDALHLVGTHNTPPAFAEVRRRLPIRPDPRRPLGRMLATKTTVHVADLMAEPMFAQERDPTLVAGVELGGIRTFLIVPMLKENELIGAFTLNRPEVRPFTDKQIELVKNFAAQAVIAIENARLLSELRQSLEQQTATSEVLQVVSSSPGDLQPVFEAMLEKAVRICDALFGVIQNWDGESLHLVATHNSPPALAEARKHLATRPSSPQSPYGRMLASKGVVQIADLAAEPAYLDQRIPTTVAAVELGGVRTALLVPMLKENEVIGAFTLSRQEVRPFTDKQIALVTNFAAQAVIAIENARLLSELRQRTGDLSESLEQQTATSEVLKVISGSPGDLQPVFDAMLENAVRICEAKFGLLYLYEGGAFRLVAARDVPPEFAEALRAASPVPGGILESIVKTGQTTHLPDFAAIPSYAQGHPLVVAAVEVAGIRSLVGVPMLRDDELIGVISIYRQEVHPFTSKQIEFVENFAAQAVIAIENARLLKELRERTEEVVKLNEHLGQRVADQVGEIERMGRLRRFLPPQVADLIVASGTEKQLESHRREITALFCDLRGFTGFSEASAPEDVMTLLRDYHAAIGEIIIKYSGTLERYAGDGVMVVFNDPVPVDNPALRAVQMALETREAMGALTEKWRELGHDVGFGIGIAHGYATLGTIGFEGRFDYAAIGTVSNVASRLCDEAKPGQILISPRVFTAVKDAVTVEPVGEFTLKGIGRPLAAYNVLAAAPPIA